MSWKKPSAVAHSRVYPRARSGTLPTPEAKKLYIRRADVDAADLTYTDQETDRAIQVIANTGKRGNTRVVYISGDSHPMPRNLPVALPCQGVR